MKVKSDSVKLLNNSKNALPTTSKLLKPKKFSNSNSSKGFKNKTKLGISMDKKKLVLAVNEMDLSSKVNSEKNKKPKTESLQTSGKVKVIKTSHKPKESQNELLVANKVGLGTPKNLKSSNKTKIVRPETTPPQLLPEITKLGSIKKSKKNKSKHIKKITNKPILKINKIKGKDGDEDDKQLNHIKKNTPSPTVKKQIIAKPKREILNLDSSNESKLDPQKVTNVVSGLLKLVSKKLEDKPVLLDVEEPIFLLVGCVKMPVCSTKQIRFKLPHSLVNELSDILLITADKKGSKIHPDKAVEHYTELLEKHGVKFIQKVIPLRSLRQEYSQYEMRRKLVDQFDLILADASITKSLPSLLGKNIMFKRKMPIAVHLNRRDLKKHLEVAVSKTQMTVKSYTASSVVQVGHTKMSAREITDNIVEVCKTLPGQFPGGWKNVRSLEIKSRTSSSLVVYMNLISPNLVKAPGESSKKIMKIEDELSTYPGMNVVVRQDGRVSIKKVKEAKLIDDSHDDEILRLAEDYKQASRTVRYSDDDDDGSDDEAAGDSITDRMEKKLLNDYKMKANRAADQKSKVDEDDEEENEEEDESSDEETPVIPLIGNKRKMVHVNKQSKGGPPNKQQSKGGPPNKQQKELMPQLNSKGPIGKPQNRGSRGGKKNKVNKGERKALIKRKKAGVK